MPISALNYATVATGTNKQLLLCHRAFYKAKRVKAAATLAAVAAVAPESVGPRSPTTVGNMEGIMDGTSDGASDGASEGGSLIIIWAEATEARQRAIRVRTFMVLCRKFGRGCVVWCKLPIRALSQNQVLWLHTRSFARSSSRARIL